MNKKLVLVAIVAMLIAPTAVLAWSFGYPYRSTGYSSSLCYRWPCDRTETFLIRTPKVEIPTFRFEPWQWGRPTNICYKFILDP